jgi:excisionase family DNA binding protein
MSSKIESGNELELAGVSRLNSIPATAKRLQVSSFTVRRLIKDGRLRSVRIGRRVMVPETVVEHAVEYGVEHRV